MGNGTTSNGTYAYTDNGTASDLAKTVEQRIAIIEKALVLQATTGVSHLQKLEKKPAAYGFHTSVRRQVKELRKRRNQALHGFDAPDLAASSVEFGDVAQKLAASIGDYSSLGKGKGSFPQCSACRSRSAASCPRFCGQCRHPFNSTSGGQSCITEGRVCVDEGSTTLGDGCGGSSRRHADSGIWRNQSHQQACSANSTECSDVKAAVDHWIELQGADMSNDVFRGLAAELTAKLTELRGMVRRTSHPEQ